MSTVEILLAQERIRLKIEISRLRYALERIQFMNIKPDQVCCAEAQEIAREALKS